MIGAARRFLRARRGAAAVEFALVSPMLLMLLFGVFEYGRYLWTVNALQQTVTQTARCMGLLNPYSASAYGCATGTAFDASKTRNYGEVLAGAYGITLADSNITLNAAAACGGLADFSQVQIIYVFNTYLPQIVPSMSAGYTINETACFPNQS